MFNVNVNVSSSFFLSSFLLFFFFLSTITNNNTTHHITTNKNNKVKVNNITRCTAQEKTRSRWAPRDMEILHILQAYQT